MDWHKGSETEIHSVKPGSIEGPTRSDHSMAPYEEGIGSDLSI